MGYHRVGFLTLALLVAFACEASAWGSCSHGCGGGRQSHRTCDEFMFIPDDYHCRTQHRSCNNVCYHDGYFSGGCHCHSGASGYCCQYCHAIANCKSGHQQCTQNGGRCTSCQPGYYSLGWNNGCRDIQECARYPCRNGARCSEPHINGYRCTCLPGYTGTNCQTDIRECASNPCRHGGRCSEPRINYYKCTCRPGFLGRNCEIDINECASSPCQNGATCGQPVPNDYKCTCKPGYAGRNCETDIPECASAPCQNGATCGEPVVSGYECTCVAGYTGTNCQTDIQECASSPCQNGGTCSEPVLNGYHCTCKTGFMGVNCEKITPDYCYLIPNTWGQWSPCSTTCGGGLRQRACTWRGQHGDSDKEECSRTCLNQGDYYGGRCHCLQGTIGACCKDIIDCASHPCNNGGNCTEGINVYSCTCPAGTIQPHCDDIPDCASHPCQNGGTCHEFVNHYTCDCVPGTTGTNCIDIPDCASTPCLNNGTCLEHVGLGTNGYTCQCPAGTTDINCQDIPDCISHPCQNGGTCNEMVNGYTCTCTTHATGANCEKDLFSRHDYVCHNGSCYIIFQRKDTWQGAKEFCEARFGHLVVPDASQEEAYIENYINSMRVRYSDAIFWIGGTKSGTASPQWVDGIRSKVYRWPSGVSDDVAGNQCLAMDGGYSFLWQAFPCNRKSHFICQERVPYTGVVG